MNGKTIAAWLVAAIAGGVLCVVGDHLHVAEEVLFYPHPVLWAQAWWVFPLFFFATLAVLGGVRVVDPSPRPLSAPPERAAVADLVAFFAAYGFTAFEHDKPNVVLVVLVLLWLARLRSMAPRVAIFCLVVAVAGTSWEAMWSAIGMFAYRQPDFVGVPRWLPALYLHAALAGVSARRVVSREALTFTGDP